MASSSTGGRKDTGPRNHLKSLAALCCMCGRKKPCLRKVTKSPEEAVRNHLPVYDSTSHLYPTSICVTCRLTVKAFEKDPEQMSRKFPPFIDYDLIYPGGISTRGSANPPPIIDANEKCSCGLCDIARKGLNYPEWHKTHSRSVSHQIKVNSVFIYNCFTLYVGYS